MPPTENADYAKGHDDGMWKALCELLQKPELAQDRATKAAKLATFPLRLGGAGLRSAVRTGPAAYWASLADVLPMLQQRCPEMARKLEQELGKGFAGTAKGLVAATAAKATLTAEGYDCPTWEQVLRGERPSKAENPELGEYCHGWQCHASSRRETYHRDGECFAS